MGSFTGAENFSAMCRALGAMSAGGISHREYIRQAFQEELLVSGVGSVSTPRVVLNGTMDQLEFSSTSGVLGGYWAIRVTLRSSNGAQMTQGVRHEFASGFMADQACRNAADAFLRATQDLVGMFVRSPGFARLVA